MPCDPKPGLWAYLVCALSALLAHPLQLAASILLLGSAVTAFLLARRRPEHGPIAWALGAVVVADLLGVALGPALASPGPYVRWHRIAFHLDEARFLVWPLALQWVAGMSFVEPCARACVRSALRISLVPFYGLMLAICVACYPALRETALSRFYACLHANALIWALVVAGAWGVRRWSIRSAADAGYHGAALEREALGPLVTPARLVASLLVALSALSAIAGPWWRGLFGPAYDAERVILVAMYAGIVGVQAWTLRSMPPKVEPRIQARPLCQACGAEIGWDKHVCQSAPTGR